MSSDELFLDDDCDPSAEDSVYIVPKGSKTRDLLQVRQTGRQTVVGFVENVPDDICVAECREQLFNLLETTGCEIVAFDMTNVIFLPSGLLGLFASVRNRNVAIQVINPSEQLRDALECTHLDRFVQAQYV